MCLKIALLLLRSNCENYKKVLITWILCIMESYFMFTLENELILQPIRESMTVTDPGWELDIPSLIPCVLLSSPVQ